VPCGTVNAHSVLEAMLRTGSMFRVVVFFSVMFYPLAVEIFHHYDIVISGVMIVVLFIEYPDNPLQSAALLSVSPRDLQLPAPFKNE